MAGRVRQGEGWTTSLTEVRCLSELARNTAGPVAGYFMSGDPAFFGTVSGNRVKLLRPRTAWTHTFVALRGVIETSEDGACRLSARITMTVAFWTIVGLSTAGLITAAALGSPAVGAPILFGVMTVAVGMAQRRRDGEYLDEMLNRIASLTRDHQ